LIENLLKYYNDSDKKIYFEEFYEFLPPKIFDSHIHLWKKSFLKEEISDNRKKQNPFLDSEIIGGFTIEDFKTAASKLFPQKEYQGLFFGLPLKEFDLPVLNDYIAQVCRQENSYGLYVPEPDMKKIPDNFFKDRFIGFKPYPDLAKFDEPEDFTKLDIDISIFDFISKEVLEFSNNYGLIMLIHLPRKGRLNDKRNIEELKKISEKYKNIKVILAHAGRSYCYEDIKNSIYEIKSINNLYVDTAMVNNFSVNKTLLTLLGPEKVLFGSDCIISMLKGKNIEINNKHYFVTKDPKLWSLSSSSMNLDFTFFIYEIIRAVKHAFEELNLGRQEIEKVFYSNSMKMIEDIEKNI